MLSSADGTHMRDVVGATLRRTRGGDVGFGFLATCLLVVVLVGVENLAATRTVPAEALLVRMAAIPLAAVLIVPALAGIYARIPLAAGDREGGSDVPDGGLRKTSRLTAATLRHRGSTLLGGACVAALASVAVGVVVVLVLHAVTLSLLTVAGYAAYALDHGQLLSATATVRLSGLLVGLGLLVGVLAVGFFDCLVCWTDAGPAVSVRESLRFARRRPLTVGGYALLVTLLFAVPVAAGAAAALLLADAVAFAVLVVGWSGAVALYANLHAQLCYRRVLPVCCDSGQTSTAEGAGAVAGEVASGGDRLPAYAVTDRPLVANPLALAVALLLVTGLLAGSASVRALDVRPTDPPEPPGEIEGVDDPDALVRPAAMPQDEASYRITETMVAYNESQDAWVPSVRFEHELDRERQRLVTTLLTYDWRGERDFSNTVYLSAKQFAMNTTDHENPVTPSDAPETAWHERVAGDWVVWSVSGFELGDGGQPVDLSPGFFDQGWEVRETSAGTVTLAVEGSEVVPMNHRGSDALADSLLAESWVEVTLDRETGYVIEIREEIHPDPEDGPDDLDPLRTHVTMENWSDHEVDRPADIEEVRLLEWLWGVASY